MGRANRSRNSFHTMSKEMRECIILTLAALLFVAAAFFLCSLLIGDAKIEPQDDYYIEASDALHQMTSDNPPCRKARQ